MDRPSIVRKGFLLKKADYVKSWRKRYFVLSKNPARLTYFKSVKDTKARNVIDLKNAEITPIDTKKEGFHAFAIKLPKPNKSVYRLSTSKKEDADAWMDALRSCASQSSSSDPPEVRLPPTISVSSPRAKRVMNKQRSKAVIRNGAENAYKEEEEEDVLLEIEKQMKLSDENASSDSDSSSAINDCSKPKQQPVVAKPVAEPSNKVPLRSHVVATRKPHRLDNAITVETVVEEGPSASVNAESKMRHRTSRRSSRSRAGASYWGGVLRPDYLEMVDKPLNELLDQAQNVRSWKISGVENSVCIYKRHCNQGGTVEEVSRRTRGNPTKPKSMLSAMVSAMHSTVYSNQNSRENKNAFKIKGSTMVKGPPHLVFRILLDLTQREQWDVFVDKATTVDTVRIQIPEELQDKRVCAHGSDVIHTKTRPLWDSQWGRIWVPPREFVYLRHWRVYSLGDDALSEFGADSETTTPKFSSNLRKHAAQEPASEPTFNRAQSLPPSKGTISTRSDMITSNSDTNAMRRSSTFGSSSKRPSLVILDDSMQVDDEKKSGYTYVIVQRSVRHSQLEKRTEDPDCIRGSIRGGGWVIHEPPSMEGSQGARTCVVTYVADLRLKGWIGRALSPQSQTKLIQSTLMKRVAALREYVYQVLHLDPRTDSSLLIRASGEAAIHNAAYPISSIDDRDSQLEAQSEVSEVSEEEAEFDVDVAALMRPFKEDGFDFGAKGLERHKNGGLKFTNKEELERQKGVTMDVLRNIGSRLMEGKSVINISLPVRIFEPRSFLQRMTDVWCYAPLFLMKAALATDPVERLKLCITFVISGLHRGCKQLKPFNPILGETFQGHFEDGTEILCEQISHHPPVSSFQVIGPHSLFQYWGRHEYAASFKPNGIIGQQLGPNYIEFRDGTRVSWNMPHLLVKGFLFGDRIMNWTGTIDFVDQMNGVGCDLQFNPDKKTGLSSFYSSSKTPSDTVRGDIYVIDNNSENGRRPVCHAEGTWLTEMTFDGEVYWQMKEYQPFTVSPGTLTGDPVLPSDCSLREDLIYLLNGEDEKAQQYKEVLEVKQRADKKLREKAKKDKKHHNSRKPKSKRR